MTFAVHARLKLDGRTFVVITVHGPDRYSVREVRPGAHVQRLFKWNGLWRLGRAGGRTDVAIDTMGEPV